MIKNIFLFFAAGALCLKFIDIYNHNHLPPAIAFGQLSVEYGNPVVHPPSPVFNVSNILPGDSISRNVKVTNNYPDSKKVTVKGVRTGPSNQSDPKLETALDITINEGVTLIYTGKLTDFLSSNPHLLGEIGHNKNKTYQFLVSFPSSAGNEFQKKAVTFDLVFDTLNETKLVINEVFYKVDKQHGLDTTHNDENCKERDKGNFSYRNKGKGDDKYCDDNGKKLGINDEWVELYNPGNDDINLKNWTLEDNSGIKTKITANKTIKGHGFAVISKDDKTWKYWDKDHNITQIELGGKIGNGLDDSGDHLLLRNPDGLLIDQVGWGNDVSVWITNQPSSLTKGSSIARKQNGIDTDLSTDWQQLLPPTPGKYN